MSKLPTTLDELADFIEMATEGQTTVPMTAHVDGHPINEVKWYSPEEGDHILELREDKCTQFDAVSVKVVGSGDAASIIVTNPDGDTSEVYFMPVVSPLTMGQVLAAINA